MYRASTPTHTFTLPFETDQIKSLSLAYSQNDKLVLKKRKDGCRLEGKDIVVELSQEEANLFCEDLPVEIQLRILTLAGKSIPSIIWEVPCDKVLDDEVLT